MRVRPTRRRVAVSIAGALALALAITGCSVDAHVAIDVPAQVDASFDDATAQQVQDAVTHAMAAAGASGAIVGVWAPWSGSWVKGVGTESFTDTTPVTTDMEFRAGRITRSMICDVLYELANESVVRLDDPVTKYVSGVPDLAGMTLVQLCDSTSGIGSYSPELFGMWIGNPTRVWNSKELASYGLGAGVAGEPGAAYRDSDAGYVLLGIALERATNTKASALLEKYVFDPLDLTSTSLPPGAASPPSATTPVLNGHHSLADAAGVMNCTDPLDITTFSSSSGYTDSGVVTNIADLGRYAQALASGALAHAGADRFAAPVAVYADGPTWYLTKGGAILPGTLVGQFGAVPGYATAAFADPSSGLSIAVVLNNSGGGGSFAEQLALQLAAIASKAPAANGGTAPDAGLPWTAQQYNDIISAHPICAAPAP